MEEKSFVVREEESSLIEIKEVIEVVKRAKWVILALAALAAVGTYAYNLSLDDYYRVNATLMSSQFSSRELMPSLNAIDAISDGSDNALLAAQLGITAEEAATIQSINIHNAASDHGLFSCTVTLTCTNTALSDKAFAGILNYLSELPYFKERLKRRKEDLQLVVDKSMKELNTMDEFKKDYSKFNEIEGLAIYPANIHSEYLEILEKTQKRAADLAEMEVAYYLNAPMIPNTPSGPKALRNSLAGFLMVIMISLPLVIIRHYFR